MNAALQQAHSNHVENTASPQLRQAANEFEASFLQELLKPLSEDSMFGSDADGSAGGSMGTVSSIAAQALADGIAKNGGLGIAKRVLSELAPVEAAQSDQAGTSGGMKCGGCAQHLPSLEETSPDGSSAETSAQASIGAPTQALVGETSAVSKSSKRSSGLGSTNVKNLSKIVILPHEMH